MTTPDLEAACLALAEAMGWYYDSDSGWFDGPHPTVRGADAALFRVPAPAAPLHEQLAFVGRLAEAVGCADDMLICVGRPSNVTMRTRSEFAPDLVLAGINAAIRAKRSGS